jgi:hypothetical protein|tara:strand:- start:882 stop:2600 length:1719 start_codon:yes stop_codon:yes gene_type:complete
MAEQDFRVQKGIVVGNGDVTVPSDHSVFAGIFDTNVAAAGVTLTGITLAADGSDSNIDVNVNPKGTGALVVSKVSIGGGDISGTTINGSTIGATTAVTSVKTNSMQLLSNTNKVTTVTGHAAAQDSITYQLPDDHPASTGYVLSSTTGGVMSWVDRSASSGTITALNDHSGNGNSLITINGSTTTELDVEATATYDGQTLHINTATDNTPAQLLLEHSYNDVAGTNFMFRLDKGAAGAANDVLGNIKWQGDDADQNQTDYALIKGDVVAATAGSEEGRLTVQLAQTSNGALADVLVLTGGDETDGTSSKVLIKGDLQVDGDTTTVNTATLEVEDLNITVAKGAADSSAADGAGLTVAGASATLNYSHSGTKWTMNKPLDITGALTADTSLTLDGVTISTAEIGVLDGVTPGTVTASKALVVDGSKDIGTLGTVTAATLTATTALTAPSLSVDSVAVLDTSSANGTSFSGSAVDLATYAFATYRTVKFVGHIVDDSTHETDAFEILVTYDGASGPGATSDVHMTTYAYISSNDTPMGTFAAVKSGSNVALQFTNTVMNFTGSYAVTTTQLIKT